MFISSRHLDSFELNKGVLSKFIEQCRNHIENYHKAIEKPNFLYQREEIHMNLLWYWFLCPIYVSVLFFSVHFLLNLHLVSWHRNRNF